MLKYILLATTMCIATPAFAQETAPPDTQQQDQTPVTEAAPAAPEAPPAAEPVATPTAANPAPAEVAVPAATAQPVAEATPAPAPATPVAEVAAAPAAAPATSQDQIAQVVTTEFASYDKDANGSLDQAEFSAWMTALLKVSDPAFAPEAPSGQAWLAAAFTQADADKNAGVNLVELTSFLTPKPAA